MKPSPAALVATIVALGGLACGKADVAAPRIVPWQLETDGAPPFVLGSYDSKEKLHCRFVHDETGGVRCLPPVPDTLAETTAFADATCQTRIYAAAPADVPALLAAPVTVPLLRVDCEPRRHAIATLATLPAGAPRFGGTPCALIDAASADQIDLVVERTDPPDRWATGTEVDGPLLENGLRVRQVESAEGKRFDDHLVIEALGKPCHFEVTPSGGWTCQPNFAQSAAHEGTDCSGPPAWSAPACSDPAFVLDGGETYPVGARWAGPVSNPIHGCSPISWPDTVDGPTVYYEHGAAATPFVAPAFTFERSGTGRLQLRGVRRDGDGSVLDDEIVGPAWPPGVPRYFDVAAKRDCDPFWTPEGRVRCIPATIVEEPAPYVIAYADAACTQPAGICPTEASCDGAIIVSTTGGENGQVHAAALHRAVGLPAAYTLGTQGCQLWVPGPPPYPQFFFTVGAVEPWDPYPEVMERNGFVAP